MTICLDGFLDRIAAAPDDDAPRLVFADWLDDQGDAAYAEFIRVQCALARRQDPPEPLRAREAELYDLLSRRWAEQLAGLATSGVFSLRHFRRGFLEFDELSIEPEVFAAWTGRWPFLLRIGRLDVWSETWGGFFACPELARVSEIVCERAQLDDPALVPFATAGHFHNLRSINLYGCRFGREGFAAFVRCPSLTGLRELALDFTGLDDADLTTLVGSPVCRSLTWLNVGGNAITDAGARALAASPHLTNLRVLQIGSQITRAGYRAVKESPNLPSLEMLDLDDEPPQE
jgi:uncharacterized protein (TIGR02996 family)